MIENQRKEILCFLYKGQDGLLCRVDFDAQQTQNPQFQVPENLLARWTKVQKPKEPTEDKIKSKTLIETAERVFLSLNETPTEDSLILRYLLALMLERKRILRRKTTSTKDAILFYYPKFDQTFVIQNQVFSLEALASTKEQLDNILTASNS